MAHDARQKCPTRAPEVHAAGCANAQFYGFAQQMPANHTYVADVGLLCTVCGPQLHRSHRNAARRLASMSIGATWAGTHTFTALHLIEATTVEQVQQADR